MSPWELPITSATPCLDSTATPDARADLYSVGVMLYQLLTGKIPRGIFLLPSAVDPALDARYDSIITRAMAGDPNQRYGTAGKFQRSSTRCSRHRSPIVPPTDHRCRCCPRREIEFHRTGTTKVRFDAEARSATGEPLHQTDQLGSLFLHWFSISALTITWIFFPRTARLRHRQRSSLSQRRKTTPCQLPSLPFPQYCTGGTHLKPAPTIVTPTIPSSPKKHPGRPGPDYRSVGHFRAWSSIPNDPVFNLDRLSAIEDVKQVYLTVGGWIVLRENGEIAGNYGGVNDRRNMEDCKWLDESLRAD